MAVRDLTITYSCEPLTEIIGQGICNLLFRPSVVPETPPFARVFAVAGAVEPEALAGPGLDLEVIPNRDQLGIPLPPFAEHC